VQLGHVNPHGNVFMFAWGVSPTPRCGESRPGGFGKRSGRKTETAPRTDFTTPTDHTDLSAKPPRYEHSPNPRPPTSSSFDATGSAE
jgi:hypothetical protein